MEARRLSGYVVEIDMTMVGDGWNEDILLSADQHYDSKFCERALLKRQFEEAKKKRSPIFLFGDWFDAMQGAGDKRGSKGAVIPEYFKDNYFDAIVNDTVTFLEPYAENIVGWAMGNHEQSVVNHHETNLVERAIANLQYITGQTILPMGYSGYIYLKMNEEGTTSSRQKIKMYYNHGSGGNSQVTRGIAKASRRGLNFPDADVVISGHIHQEYIVPVERVRVTSQGRVYTDTQYHLQLPSYKNVWKDTDGNGYEHEREMAPSPVGGCWLNISRRYTDKKRGIVINPRRAC